jgi:hypothetical protein
MPFCALPKNVAELLKRRRVVVNEANVGEFVSEAQASIGESNTLAKKSSNRLSEFLSPRSLKSSNSSSSAAIGGGGGGATSAQYGHQPILAAAPNSNPFYNDSFPVNYTNSKQVYLFIFDYECFRSRK